MLEQLRGLPAVTLERASYRAEFREHWDQIEDAFWKLERMQSFSEPGNASWRAFLEGRQEDSIRLIESKRASMTERYQRAKACGFEARRVRIVEYPISSYLRWELNAHRIRVETGEDIRVLEAAKLGDLEARGTLPELVILGRQVMYQILYDENGAGAGARKFVDQDLIHACRVEMAQLWEQAEEFLPFLEREVLPLPPLVPTKT